MLGNCYVIFPQFFVVLIELEKIWYKIDIGQLNFGLFKDFSLVFFMTPDRNSGFRDLMKVCTEVKKNGLNLFQKWAFKLVYLINFSS